MITTLQLIILTVYILYIMYDYGKVLPSISESAYTLGRKRRYLFTGALWLVAMLNYFQPMEMYGALASAGLFFTGVTVSFKSDSAHGNIVHYVGAGTAIIVSFLGLVMLYGLWWVPLIALICTLPFIKSKNLIWWVEIVSILTIFITYYFI